MDPPSMEIGHILRVEENTVNQSLRGVQDLLPPGAEPYYAIHYQLGSIHRAPNLRVPSSAPLINAQLVR